jgi:phage anti-repressor protein
MRKQYTNWAKHQIESLGLVENQDFVQLPQKVKVGVKIDHYFTLNAAKHIAMASRSPKRDVEQPVQARMDP